MLSHMTKISHFPSYTSNTYFSFYDLLCIRSKPPHKQSYFFTQHTPLKASKNTTVCKVLTASSAPEGTLLNELNLPPVKACMLQGTLQLHWRWHHQNHTCHLTKAFWLCFVLLTVFLYHLYRSTLSPYIDNVILWENPNNQPLFIKEKSLLLLANWYTSFINRWQL